MRKYEKIQFDIFDEIKKDEEYFEIAKKRIEKEIENEKHRKI